MGVAMVLGDMTFRDVPLLLLSLFASITTFLVITIHGAWIALTVALRKRGCRVTLMKHQWGKIEEAIANVDSEAERKRYHRWGSLLRYIYVAWAMAMILFLLTVLFICS
jgi:hypothetical protein